MWFLVPLIASVSPPVLPSLPPVQTLPAQIAHGNGIKIGEVTPTSVILWTRLTQEDEAQHRVAAWDSKELPWRAPHASGEVRFEIRAEGDDASTDATEWTSVGPASDGCHQVLVEGLTPGTSYLVRAMGRSAEATSAFQGSFTTAPDLTSEESLTFVISTCQDFHRRDDLENGHRIYRSMLALEPAFFVQTGDTLYYDRPKPYAKDLATARYKWNRLYSLPNLRAFHAKVPSYWMHDDHDLLKDDCWPGQSFGDLTFEAGCAIWREQVPMSEKPYRTFRWGAHAQVWLPEGREYRSPNNLPDGPKKTILGEEQWRWLEESLGASDATFKFYVSATPVVGPDRLSKKDNHANAGFAHEGKRLRELLASIPGLVVINGDRHWQYHSIDPDTDLHEFGCGPASDAHAAGFSKANQKPWQPFLRIAGGFLTVTVGAKNARLTHHAVDGSPVNETVIPSAR